MLGLVNHYIWSLYFTGRLLVVVIVQSLRLVILVFEECLELLRGGVTLRCRLLVIVQSLRLVILVFEECLELLQGGVTLRCRLLVIVQSLRLVTRMS